MLTTLINNIKYVLVAALLFGCSAAGPTINNNTRPSDHYQAFINGNVLLQCHTSCAGKWGANRKKIRNLYNQRQWFEVAVRVMEIGYGTDLSYFYLGRTAQELGYPAAAQTYYYLSLSAMECGGIFNVCDGFIFPQDINSRLNQLRQANASGVAAIQTPSTSDVATGKSISGNETPPAQLSPVSGTVGTMNPIEGGLPLATTPITVANSVSVTQVTSTASTEAQLNNKNLSPRPTNSVPKSIKKGYRGDSIVDLIGKFKSIDKLSKDEFTKSSRVISSAAELRSRDYRFVVPTGINNNYSSDSGTDSGVRYDADAGNLHINLWAGSQIFISNWAASSSRSLADQPYATIVVASKTQRSKYIGQNTFGVKANITSTLVEEYGLAFENEEAKTTKAMFSASFPANPREARSLKDDLAFYIDVEMTSSDALKGNVLEAVNGHDATINAPTEFYISGNYLLAKAKEIGVYRKSTGEVLMTKKLK